MSQQIFIPVLSPAYTTISCFDLTNRSFCFIVCSRKVLSIITLPSNRVSNYPKRSKSAPDTPVLSVEECHLAEASHVPVSIDQIARRPAHWSPAHFFDSASFDTDAFPSYFSGYTGEHRDDLPLVCNAQVVQPNFRPESVQRRAPIAAFA